jgi:ATP-dependent Clp protease ATP-binding subunit ClpC
VKKTFNPEFLNRLDEVILFQSLSDADLIQIVELLVQSSTPTWRRSRSPSP